MNDEFRKDTLFYDGQCPLCEKEIRWLKKVQDGLLDFQNIHERSNQQLPIDKVDMLKQLHLQLPSGEYLIGLDATVRSWSHTPYGILLKPLRWPILRNIADHFYHQWAERRYRKRYECSTCFKQ